MDISILDWLIAMPSSFGLLDGYIKRIDELIKIQREYMIQREHTVI